MRKTNYSKYTKQRIQCEEFIAQTIGKLKEHPGTHEAPRAQQEQEVIAIPVAEGTMRGDVAIRVQSWVHPAGTRTTVEVSDGVGPWREVLSNGSQSHEEIQLVKKAQPKAEQKGNFLVSPLLPLLVFL